MIPSVDPLLNETEADIRKEKQAARREAACDAYYQTLDSQDASEMLEICQDFDVTYASDFFAQIAELACIERPWEIADAHLRTLVQNIQRMQAFTAGVKFQRGEI